MSIREKWLTRTFPCNLESADPHLQVWIDKMRKRPIMTGGYLRPSWFNKPLPRLNPQPIHISMMIASRRKARASRTVRFEQYNEWKEDMKHEARFERLLQEELPPEQAQQFQMIFQDREWGTSIIYSLFM